MKSYIVLIIILHHILGVQSFALLSSSIYTKPCIRASWKNICITYVCINIQCSDRMNSHVIVFTSNDDNEELTNGLLLVSFDGSRFTGWAGNDSDYVGPSDGNKLRNNVTVKKNSNGWVRSVEGVLRSNLAKLYGNINEQRRIIVEGSSRTDKGVHARGMVVHFYCIDQFAWDIVDQEQQQQNPSTIPPIVPSSLEPPRSRVSIARTIPGKRMPHPMNSTDTTYYVPIPMPLEKIAFALNRMLPDDVRIKAIAVPPRKNNASSSISLSSKQRSLPFHATQSAILKTYQYEFVIGSMYSNLGAARRSLWHCMASNETSAAFFDHEAVGAACVIFKGQHDFSSFRGSPRNLIEKQKQNDPICNIHSVTVQQTRQSNHAGTSISDNYTTNRYVVSIVGDRFLYKMCRFIVGALVAIGTNKMTLDDLRSSLKGEIAMQDEEANAEHQLKNCVNTSHRLFQCAPAHGLILHNVTYDPPIPWITAHM